MSSMVAALLAALDGWPPTAPSVGRIAYDERAAALLLATPTETLDELAQYQACQALERAWTLWLWRRNQFVQLSVGHARALWREADAVLRALADSAPDASPRVAAVVAHRTRLASLMQTLAGAYLAPVTSGNYSVAMMEAALGIDIATLRGPVLDVGCGDGTLVHALRTAGLEASGFDRALPAPSARANLTHAVGTSFSSLTEAAQRQLVVQGALWTADWLTWAYAPNKFATIISHLGFSLFFAHYHHRGDAIARQYAIAYRKQLEALAPGGAFYYTPALPFVEAHLPTGYRLTTHEVATGGDSSMQSARVTRDSCGVAAP